MQGSRLKQIVYICNGRELLQQILESEFKGRKPLGKLNVEKHVKKGSLGI